MDEPQKPRDPGLSSAFKRSRPQHSVLTRIEERTGQAPRVSLSEADDGSAGSPLINPASEEKLSLPDGRGSYQLMGEIARGGMGVILKGHDTDLGRDVALKVLNADLAERPDVVQRFVEEAQIGGQLQHPGIVPVYELGLMADERPYFTMKLVKGRTFATLLAERESVAASRSHMLDVFASICQTMGYAHSRGVIHRDLKPANIMVGAFGEVQVVDWGLAKVLARGGTADEKRAKESRPIQTILETVRSTGSGSGSGTDSLVGSVMGTPAYMPPEQAAGHVDRLDERSDVFSLGAILCEILTGRPPYTGERERTLLEAAQANLDPALARLDECGADPDLVQLTKQCLLPAAEVRPRNAGVLAQRIHEHVATLEERAQAARIEAVEARVRAEEATVHAQEERRARKLTLLLAAAVVGLVAVGGGGFLWVSNERAAREREEIARERAAAERERELAAQVGAAVNAAATLQGQERWADASAALDRAAALAEAGQAGESVHASVASARANLRAASEAAAERAKRARAGERLLAELEEVGAGEDLMFSGLERSVDEGYERTFLEHGIDVDGSPPEEVVAALADLGVEHELAPLLDNWLAVRRMVAREEAGRDREPDLSRCLRLVEVQHRIDDDPLRADLREALVNDDAEMITYLAQSDLEAQPPSTLLLLGTALELTGERDEALRILREGSWRHRDDLGLLAALLRILAPHSFQGTPESAELRREAKMHARAASSLRPENNLFRIIVLIYSLVEADRAALMGEAGIARERYRRFIEQIESLEGPDRYAYYQKHYATALLRSGETEAGLAALRRVAEEAADALESGPRHGGFRELFKDSIPDLLRAGELGLVERGLARYRELEPTNFDVLYRLVFVRALQRVRDGEPEDVVEVLETAVAEAGEERDRLRNDLAWCCVRWTPEVLRAACTPPEGGDPERLERNLEAIRDQALGMSEAAAAATDEADKWNTLAWARYRTGDDEGSREALARSTRERSTISDLLLLAILHQRAGDGAEAARWYDRAQRAMDEAQVLNRIKVDETLAFRAEARAALGLGSDER